MTWTLAFKELTAHDNYANQMGKISNCVEGTHPMEEKENDSA
jgi:hypothetical protein